MAQKELPSNLTWSICYSDPENSGGDSREPELRIVLVGITGSGKSAVGNNLLGRTEFESMCSSGSVTKVCRKAKTTWNGKNMAVIDTPGIFDTEIGIKENLREIARFTTVSSPGPHALLLVMEIGRFTKEKKAAVGQLFRLLGAEAVKFLIIVFTRKDDLVEESVGDFVRNINDPCFQELLKKCEHRYCAFNNKASGAQRDAQVSELMAMIEKMVQNNGNTHYTNDIYESVEKLLQMETAKKMEDSEKEKNFEKEKKNFKEENKNSEDNYKKKQEKFRNEAENDENILLKIAKLIWEKIKSFVSNIFS